MIGTKLSPADRIGSLKVRLGIGRMSYLVPPGLYAVGSPTPDDPVLVTANYKMSYDSVRKELSGRNVWLLVLETFGINVWCAAGKGTFGTEELVRRTVFSGLGKAVRHRQLILPILGAPGVAGHIVKARTGFTIRYATIRAADLPEFLDNGMVTTPAMREMTFSLRERLTLIPVELAEALKPTALILGLIAGLAGFVGGASSAWLAVAAYLGAVLAGVALAPLMLPWLPGRSFSLKGAMTGMAWSVAWCLIAARHGAGPLLVAAALLALPAVSAFYTLNFTGCTPFTSRSGVKKEMRLALPVMGSAILLGLLLVATSRFI